MTARPSRVLSDEVFVHHDDRPESYNPTVRGLHQSDSYSHALATFQELNRQSVDSNWTIHSGHGIASISTRNDDAVTKPSLAHDPVQFQAHTISPSPSLSVHTAGDISVPSTEFPPLPPMDSDSFLSLSTDIPPTDLERSNSLKGRHGSLATPYHNSSLQRKTSNSNLQPVSRTPSWKQHLTRGIGSATSSAYSSPVLSAMGDVTPLPSPLLPSDSPGPWRRLAHPIPSKELTVPTIMPDSVLITTTGESVAAALEHQTKRKAYVGLQVGHAAEHSSGKNEHTRNRSISEYIPDAKGVLKRQNTVSTGKVDERNREDPAGLRREPRFSEARGLTIATKPPTPPPSESSQNNDNSTSKRPSYEYFEAHGRKDQKLRRWRGVKDLGEGTFSRVVLATSRIDTKDVNEDDGARTDLKGSPKPANAPRLDQKTLVAIKICEHGPKGGASEDRIEMSLKRELDIMQSIDHPSLVHLKAWNIEPTRALLVMNYSPGGDLFDFASSYRDLLKAPMLRRIFSEIIGAVGYLHERRIVHRDIKLENVLVNIPPAELISHPRDWGFVPISSHHTDGSRALPACCRRRKTGNALRFR
ncbi:hypothetical protein NUW58_g8049 [Xylaria curta]|uniref:Uncharacterized protein n=1 Tax=Xylaria curta TaxID=42375 RepID=A0ACC1NBB5_9PEZI|nr:hypothetical protein NUW58_g8049 [Xylaria curta]